MSILNQALKDFVAKERKASFYFDLNEIDKNLSFLQGLQDEQVQFIFPVKSFSRAEVLRLANQRLSGFDVSNQPEMDLIRSIKRDHATIWSSSPILWSSGDLDIFMDGAHLGVTWPAGVKRSLRVHMDDVALHPSSRFGTSLKTLAGDGLVNNKICALHFHHGDEGTSKVVLPFVIKKIASLVKQLDQVTHINLGGSFGSLGQQEIADIVLLARQELPNKKIIFEPGRWLSRNAGFLIGKIEEINAMAGRGYITTSLSRDCHLRWHNQKFKLSFHPMNLNTPIGCSDVVVGGATCHEADTIGTIQNSNLKLSVGDLVVVSDVTGYSLAWNHSFNGIAAADVVFMN